MERASEKDTLSATQLGGFIRYRILNPSTIRQERKEQTSDCQLEVPLACTAFELEKKAVDPFFRVS